MPDYETLETDILILGSGGAGQLAALHARDAGRGARIVLAVKGLFGKSG